MIQQVLVRMETPFSQEDFARWLLAVLKNLAKEPESVVVEPVGSNNDTV